MAIEKAASEAAGGAKTIDYRTGIGGRGGGGEGRSIDKSPAKTRLAPTCEAFFKLSTKSGNSSEEGGKGGKKWQRIGWGNKTNCGESGKKYEAVHL